MRVSLLLALLAAASPALANHPAERLDEVMAEREPAFEAVEGSLPDLSLKTDGGREYNLREQSDQILVLSFVPEGCGAPCAEQQQLLTEVQSRINVTPMRELVSFVTVAAPGTSIPQDSEPRNWQHTMPHGKETAADLSADMVDGLQRADGPMAHIIDRGRRRAIFHGTEFGPVDMVLYINGLTNAPPPEPTFFERLSEWLP